MNIDKKRKQECQTANCGLDKERCLVSYGNSCIRVSGMKIPVQGAPSERRNFPQSSMKAYFICDGREVTEGREFE